MVFQCLGNGRFFRIPAREGIYFMDMESLLSPLAGDQPSGVELRNDARFHAIERLLEPASRENRLKADGTINEAAAPVDWENVLSEGVALAGEGRDLRLLVILVRGLCATAGFSGLIQGIELLQCSVAQYWDSLHPALRDRPDPQMAAMARSNALRQLDNDDNGLLGDLRFSTAFSPRGIGPVSFDDVAAASLSDFDVLARMASGLGKAEKDAILTRHQDRSNRAKAACRAMVAQQGEEISAMIGQISDCLNGIDRLVATFSEKAGISGAGGLSLPDLTSFLANFRKSLEKSLADSGNQEQKSQPSDGVTPRSDNAPADPGGGNDKATNGIFTAQQIRPESISSREDVEAALDRIVAFYERTEPSSPIPHVARRLRRMVAMDFLQLMQEIAPSGLKEFRNIAGLEDPKK